MENLTNLGSKIDDILDTGIISENKGRKKWNKIYQSYTRLRNMLITRYDTSPDKKDSIDNIKNNLSIEKMSIYIGLKEELTNALEKWRSGKKDSEQNKTEVVNVQKKIIAFKKLNSKTIRDLIRETNMESMYRKFEKMFLLHMKMKRLLRVNRIWKDVTLLYQEMRSKEENYVNLMIDFCKIGINKEQEETMSKLRSDFKNMHQVLKEFSKVLEVMRRYAKNIPLTSEVINQDIVKIIGASGIERMQLKEKIIKNALSLLDPMTLKFNTMRRVITNKEIKHPSVITDKEEFIKEILFDVDLNLLDRLYLPVEINPDQEGDVFYKFRKEGVTNSVLVIENDNLPVLRTTRDIRAGEELIRFMSSDSLLGRYNLQPTKEKKMSLEDYINNLQGMQNINPVELAIRVEKLKLLNVDNSI